MTRYRGTPIGSYPYVRGAPIKESPDIWVCLYVGLPTQGSSPIYRACHIQVEPKEAQVCWGRRNVAAAHTALRIPNAMQFAVR